MHNLIAFLMSLWLVTPCWAGASRDFESGSSDYIDMGTPSVLTFNRPFTLMAWIKLESTGVTSGVMSHGCGEWYMRISTDDKIHLIDSQVAEIANSTTALSSATWYHVCVTAASGSPGAVAFYLNGVADGTSSTSANFNDPPAGPEKSAKFGADEECNLVIRHEFMDGLIAYGQIFTRVLSVGEINEAMHHPGSITENLVGYYPLFGVDSPELDLSGNGNSGTVTGATAFSDGPPVMLMSIEGCA